MAPRSGGSRRIARFRAVIECPPLRCAGSPPQHEHDHGDWRDHEQNLVPATLVREHARIVEGWRERNEVDVGMRQRVEETIDVIRPVLHADGGDIELRDVDEQTGVVTVSLIGACGTCPASDQTLKAGIERIMRDRVDGVTEVVAV